MLNYWGHQMPNSEGAQLAVIANIELSKKGLVLFRERTLRLVPQYKLFVLFRGFNVVSGTFQRHYHLFSIFMNVTSTVL